MMKLLFDSVGITCVVWLVMVCVLFMVCLSGVSNYMANQIYMDADDPNNPVGYGGCYITNEVKYIADSIVDEDDTPHEKTVKFMEWTRENINFGYGGARQPHPHTIIESNRGQCGDYAIGLTYSHG